MLARVQSSVGKTGAQACGAHRRLGSSALRWVGMPPRERTSGSRGRFGEEWAHGRAAEEGPGLRLGTHRRARSRGRNFGRGSLPRARRSGHRERTQLGRGPPAFRPPTSAAGAGPGAGALGLGHAQPPPRRQGSDSAFPRLIFLFCEVGLKPTLRGLRGSCETTNMKIP